MKPLLLLLALTFAAHATPLGSLSDTLKPGKWAELPTTGYPAWSIVSDIMAYANTGCWYEDSGFALFVGSVHAGHNHHLLTYVDSSNSWRCGPKLDGNIFPYTFGTHAYDNDALDPTRGAFWYSPKGNDLSVACGSDYACASDQWRRRFIRYDIKSDAWDSGIVMPDTFPAPSNTTGLKYFPEMDGLVFVNSTNAEFARVFFYSFKTATWRILGQGMSMGGEHMFCQYSSRHKVILFGGGDAYPSTPNYSMYKIDTTGSITKLKNIPSELPFGIIINRTRFVEDPGTGDFLALDNSGNFWCYNLPTDYWQKLPTPSIPSGASSMAIAVPRYNVVMYNWGSYLFTGGVKVLIYKHAHPHQDTVKALAIHVTAPAVTTERYLAVPLTVTVDFSDSRTDTVTPFALYRSLDTNLAKVDAGGVVRGVRAGQVDVEVTFVNRHGTVMDTLSLTFLPSTAVIDSVRFNTNPAAVFMNRDTFVLMQDSSYLMTGTVYGHKDTEFFTHPLDSSLVWSSLSTGVATVDYGKVTAVSAGGPAAIVAAQGGQSDTIRFTVYPKLSFIKRINFQAPYLTAPFGWFKQGYEDAYSASRGYGWPSGNPSDNNRVTTVPNFLLQTRQISYSGTNFRLDMPAGEYIIKAGMGNVASNTGAQNWLALGTDTLMKWSDKTGQAGIQVDTVTVTGSNMTLRFLGYLCYLVVISKEGTDINVVADDGGLTDNIPGSGTGTSVERQDVLPDKLDLTIAPNPANPSMAFSVDIPKSDANATLSVFDASGRQLCSWKMAAGTRRMVWNGADDKGVPVSAGVYVIRLTTAGQTLVRKGVLAR